MNKTDDHVMILSFYKEPKLLPNMFSRTKKIAPQVVTTLLVILCTGVFVVFYKQTEKNKFLPFRNSEKSLSNSRITRVTQKIFSSKNLVIAKAVQNEKLKYKSSVFPKIENADVPEKTDDSKNYHDVKQFIEKIIVEIEKFNNRVEKVKSAPDLTVALNSFADVAECMKTEMVRLQKKYPELPRRLRNEEVLKDSVVKLEKVMAKIFSTAENLKAYENDKEVQIALDRIKKVFIQV